MSTRRQPPSTTNATDLPASSSPAVAAASIRRTPRPPQAADRQVPRDGIVEDPSLVGDVDRGNPERPGLPLRSRYSTCAAVNRTGPVAPAMRIRRSRSRGAAGGKRHAGVVGGHPRHERADVRVRGRARRNRPARPAAPIRRGALMPERASSARASAGDVATSASIEPLGEPVDPEAGAGGVDREPLDLRACGAA